MIDPVIDYPGTRVTGNFLGASIHTLGSPCSGNTTLHGDYDTSSPWCDDGHQPRLLMTTMAVAGASA